MTDVSETGEGPLIRNEASARNVRHAVVVAHGDVAGSETWLREQLNRASLIVAADGGAAALWQLGRCPDVIVGDFDSLPMPSRQALEARGCVFESHPRDKDQTDSELALLAARRLGARSITVLGALGGPRLDHALANVFLLAMPELQDVEVRIMDARHSVRLLRGPAEERLSGKVGDLVTLLPMTESARGVTTTSLRYGLDDGLLELGRGRGVSNEMTATEARVHVHEGLLLVIQHRLVGGMKESP